LVPKAKKLFKKRAGDFDQEAKYASAIPAGDFNQRAMKEL
jgi:hypothetical protein